MTLGDVIPLSPQAYKMEAKETPSHLLPEDAGDIKQVNIKAH